MFSKFGNKSIQKSLIFSSKVNYARCLFIAASLLLVLHPLAPCFSQSEEQKVAIVLPTYNESETLHELILALRKHMPRAWILIVDDASQDGTGVLAEEEAQKDPLIKVFHRRTKLGLGTAYLEGFKNALKMNCDIIIQMDADFSHDPAALPLLVAALQEGDVIIGSRYVAGGSISNWSYLRRLISFGGSFYARTILGMPYFDLTSGFKVWKSAALKAILKQNIKSKGFAFQIETTYRAHQSGLRVVEIPIHFQDRKAGNSKMNLSIALEAIYICWWLLLDASSYVNRPL